MIKIEIEIRKDYGNDVVATEKKTFINEKDAYQYIMLEMLDTYLDQAKESLDDNAFTSLCLNICGFMAEYFT